MEHDHENRRSAEEVAAESGSERRRGHSHWMMMLCCVPMILIAIALVATGVVGFGFILIALACTAMMAAMMFGMSGGAR